MELGSKLDEQKNNMDNQFDHNDSESRSKPRAVRWVKQWVTQDTVATGGKCSVLKWVKETTAKALNEKSNELAAPDREPEPEPKTEVLFLCSYEGCGKTFIDVGPLRKHSQIHGQRQHVCPYEGCAKKFLDSSKLKRHTLVHTGEKDFLCPHEGCGKAFSLDFNLRSHMKTHSQENYHTCPYPECGKRYAHEYKLKNHISSHHEKNMLVDVPKCVEKQVKTRTPSKATAGVYGSASSDRPFACPYEGCGKDYIHQYKLRLHLKREHPDHDENAEHALNTADNEMVDEDSDQDVYYAGKRSNGKRQKKSRGKPNMKFPPAAVRKGSAPSQATTNTLRKPRPVEEIPEVVSGEDSEKTDSDRDDEEDGGRYAGNNDGDDIVSGEEIDED